MLGLIISIFQNFGNKNSYTLGFFSCSVPSTTLVFIVKVIYIFFWTWVLNLICKDGHSGISWGLVLFPFILLFVLLGLLMVSNTDVYYIEGFYSSDSKSKNPTAPKPKKASAPNAAVAPAAPAASPAAPPAASPAAPAASPAEPPQGRIRQSFQTIWG